MENAYHKMQRKDVLSNPWNTLYDISLYKVEKGKDQEEIFKTLTVVISGNDL